MIEQLFISLAGRYSNRYFAEIVEVFTEKALTIAEGMARIICVCLH